jgi:hypothetical protein
MRPERHGKPRSSVHLITPSSFWKGRSRTTARLRPRLKRNPMVLIGPARCDRVPSCKHRVQFGSPPPGEPCLVNVLPRPRSSRPISSPSFVFGIASICLKEESPLRRDGAIELSTKWSSCDAGAGNGMFLSASDDPAQRRLHGFGLKRHSLLRGVRGWLRPLHCFVALKLRIGLCQHQIARDE